MRHAIAVAQHFGPARGNADGAAAVVGGDGKSDLIGRPVPAMPPSGK
jgi:hypothetical protein